MSKRVAICIGVNEYINAPEANLEFARSDAEMVAALLGDPVRGGFDEVNEIFDEQAKKADILQEIDALLYDPNLTQDDLVLIYFSGHGALDKSDNLFLLPHDADYHYSGGLIDMTSTVHVKELEIRLENTQVGSVVVILDACHGGASGKLLGRIKYRDDANVILIGAARYSEKAWEAPEFQQGRFTECLLRAANARPTQGEWITLQQMLATVQVEMQKLGDEQMMEISSHIVDTNIRLFKNPNYSLASQTFTDEVKGLCKLAGYHIARIQSVNLLPNCFITQEQGPFGLPRHMLVICFDNDAVEVLEADLMQFLHLYRALQPDFTLTGGMVITRNALPHSFHHLLTSSIPVAIRTKDDLQRNLIRFERYLERLIDQFEKQDPERHWDPPLKQYYIELDGQHLVRKIGHKPITELIAEWLMTDNQPAAIVFGGYGTGKTTFARKLAHDLAQDYLSHSDKQGLRIPVLLYLREFPRGYVDIEALIITHLKRHCGVNNPDFSAFEAMNEAGLLLLIFDGFDEMVVRADEDTIRRNLAAIERFAPTSNSKILLTSRPEFFRSADEERRILAPSDTLFRKRPHYQRFALLHLKPEQVEEYLQKRIPLLKEKGETTREWHYYRDQINQIPGFEDLTRRAVLLEMIVKTLPELIARQEQINRASLYNRYLRGEIARQQEQKQRQFLIKKEDRFRLMQIIARHFYTENPAGLTAKQILELLKEQFSGRQREELEAHMRDFLNASFLIRESDQYRFSHRSIMEYLAAKDLADEIETNKPNVFKQYKLTPEVRDFLVDLKPEPDQSWRDRLWAWINSTKGETEETVKYLGGNAVTVLNFMKESFVEKDFQDTVLLGANLRRAQCQGASFRRCNCKESDLTGCDLTETDLTDIYLFGKVFCDTCGASSKYYFKICTQCSAPLNLHGNLFSLKGTIIGKAKGLDNQLTNTESLQEWWLNNGAVEKYSDTNQVTNLVEPTPLAKIRCPTCSMPNMNDAITCWTCGTSLNSKPDPIQYVCSGCQTGITPGTRFCPICGLPFSEIQCQSCHILNPRKLVRCYSCRTPLPLSPTANHSEPPSKVTQPSILCRACGVLNLANLRFCTECNHELKKAVECPECGCPTIPRQAFCEDCGVNLITPPPPPPKVPSLTSLKPSPDVSQNVCPQCSAPMQPGAVFCDTCGVSLQAGAPPIVMQSVQLPSRSHISQNLCSHCGALTIPTLLFCMVCGIRRRS